eukprot:4650718-Lingulodinium_polyedra.AAC.1
MRPILAASGWCALFPVDNHIIGTTGRCGARARARARGLLPSRLHAFLGQAQRGQQEARTSR